MEEKRILGVGLVCLDIINECEYYPSEDEDIRAVSQLIQSGGNACNFLKVLVQLGIQCDFLGSLSYGNGTDFVLNDFKQRGIGTRDCVFHKDCGFPTSCAVISQAVGSRTIVHSRNGLPEVTSESFEKINLSQYSWVHFEGRNPPEILKMIKTIQAFNETLKLEDDRIYISIELEKKRSELSTLLPHADVVFISKEFAKYCGYKTSEKALEDLHARIKDGGILVCAWGDQGASGVDSRDGIIVHSDAYPPGSVLDTLGAGDTFIASVVYSLHQKKTLAEALLFGCQLAGKKCGIKGFDNLLSC